MRHDLPIQTTLEVRDRCLCLHLQRAARAIARRFDEALRPLGLNNGQYSLLMSLNRPEPPRISDLAAFLAMDRTTLTANTKPLARRGLLEIIPDARDRRSRRLRLTDAGRDLLVAAVPVWRATHDGIDRLLPGTDAAALRADLRRLSSPDEDRPRT
ncbi:MarR family winged helix-turn-helix transcriptional regulator [Pontibaca methylaminivorans]|uniref:MarR family winged helix-turn-helix transcriptional regulator n=1 Tax=Pontibaca methylaminivorans TaxID=515897 RepID=UPI002FD8D152